MQMEYHSHKVSLGLSGAGTAGGSLHEPGPTPRSADQPPRRLSMENQRPSMVQSRRYSVEYCNGLQAAYKRSRWRHIPELLIYFVNYFLYQYVLIIY